MPEQYMEQYVSRRQSAPRLEFEAAAIYEYPEHLRPWLEALPKQPGVYFFHGESDTMPLYIGKSVNIRSRVLSHLRTPDEAAMLRQSRRITWIQTAGELGALLLEARLIKEQQPLFNKRLRRNRQLCSIQVQAGKPQVVYAREVDFSQEPNLYGLFANKRAALQTVQTLADELQLCYGLLGLEATTRGRACFPLGAQALRRSLLWKGERGSAPCPFSRRAGLDSRQLLALGRCRGAERDRGRG
ncbi:Excinuclease Cho [Enterobacter cancerogenus]|uniref:Excinuclease cho n=1 Tax=Enterobacter cancerogenus TaxID=69218 RepID=A0A484ZG52_9ENTR|nr:Excinuclease Cho [Enterobacter cancerogenus]